MSGFDGTGPRGRGPMTGGGDGYCMLKIPCTPDEPPTGFAGRFGKPVVLSPDPTGSDVDSLRARRRVSGLRSVTWRAAWAL